MECWCSVKKSVYKNNLNSHKWKLRIGKRSASHIICISFTYELDFKRIFVHFMLFICMSVFNRFCRCLLSFNSLSYFGLSSKCQMKTLTNLDILLYGPLWWLPMAFLLDHWLQQNFKNRNCFCLIHSTFLIVTGWLGERHVERISY